MPPQLVQPELTGKLDAPLNRGQREGAFYAMTLDAPHQGFTRAILDGEVSGWSKARARLGKKELEQGDPIIIKSYRMNGEAVVALEIG